jgi:hypothetical protein
MGEGRTDANNRVLGFTMKLKKLEKSKGEDTEGKKKVATSKDLEIA